MKKVRLIANPRAGSVSRRTKQVIKHALAAEFKLEADFTESRNHATELARDAVDRGFDAVLAFGGDGTVNETVQPLVGTDVKLGVIPGGSTNVLARTLGLPRDPVDATEFVAAKLRSDSSTRIGVGRMNDRYFLVCSGMGLDAEVVRRVEADRKPRGPTSEWRFLKHALAAGSTEYRTREACITVEAEGSEPVKALFAVCANARPFTYFKGFPVDALPEAGLHRRLDILSLNRLRIRTLPRIAWSVFVSRSHIRWRSTDHFPDVASARFTSDRPDPIQVDGDYIGVSRHADLRHVPDSLNVLF